jgi:hypothetical protein
MSDKKTPTKKQILKAIEELEKNPHDKVKILGEAGITVLGAAGAGAIAAVVGTTTVSIPIITAVTGVGMVVAAPVGLVAGAAIAGGMAAYGLSQLVKSGGYMEGKTNQLIIQLKENISEVETKERKSRLTDDDKTKFHIFLKDPIKLDLISPQDAQDLIAAVENGRMPLKQAYFFVEDILKAAQSGNSK